MVITIAAKQVIVYRTEKGKEPYVDWLDSLRDPATQRRIIRRVLRVQDGNYGDYKPLKDGVFELRLDFGSGYRVYFGEDGNKIVILLCGGDKSSQKRDIKTAKQYWKEYKND